MRYPLLLLLAIGLSGCGSTKIEAQNGGRLPDSEQPPTKVASNGSDQQEIPTAAPETGASGEVQAQKDKDPAHNPDRLYQLKDLKTTTLTIGKHKIKVWLMDTDSKRQEGMMFLKDPEVKIEQGMLFVFPAAKPQSFWMHNTLIDLDLAYIKPNGTVLNIVRMKSLDETGRPSEGDAQFVLEMKAGAFKKFDIKPGTKISIPKSVKTGE